MKLNSIILGIATTAVLLAVLVVTRMMVLTTTAEEFEIREIETVSLPEPPPAPAEEIPEEEVPPPPPPALVDLRATSDMTQPALPVATLKVDPTLAVDTFFSDQPPSPLPTIAKPRTTVKPSKPKTTRPKVKSRPLKSKSQYSLGELDKAPRVIRRPSRPNYPRSIKERQGVVKLRIAILPNGSAQYISLVSTTHEQLVPLAKRMVSQVRFTSPTRQGKPVKAVMTWPIIIKK